MKIVPRGSLFGSPHFSANTSEVIHHRVRRDTKMVCPQATALIRCVSFLFCTSLLIALSVVAIFAQSDAGITDMSNPGMGGKNVIEGHIYYPSGHPLDKRLRIEINSVQSGAASTLTTDNGTFLFERLPDGTYNLTINAGKEYEEVNETVQIVGDSTRNKRGQVITLQVQLQPKSTTRVRPAVTNAELAGVPQHAREVYLKALASAQTGDHKTTIEQLEKAISLAPGFALAFNELGIQYLQLNRLEKAAEAFRSAIKLAPDAFIPRLNYGYVLLQQKKDTEAELELRRAMERNESSAAVHLYRARALIRMQRGDEAEKELQRALALGGDEANLAHRYLGALYIERGEKERAISELETYLRLMPTAQDASQIREIIKGLHVKPGS
jgi:tetratricopeptide (TPR) repeat protein